MDSVGDNGRSNMAWHLQPVTLLSACLTGNLSSSMSGPFRHTRPPSQVRDTSTRRGCCRAVTMWPSSVTTSQWLRPESRTETGVSPQAYHLASLVRFQHRDTERARRDSSSFSKKGRRALPWLRRCRRLIRKCQIYIDMYFDPLVRKWIWGNSVSAKETAEVSLTVSLNLAFSFVLSFLCYQSLGS